MSGPSSFHEEAEGRVRRWHHAGHAAVCDVLEPWQYGTVARATRYPRYFDFNVVRVERSPEMSVDELVAFADEALAGLAHRRLDFESIEAAEPLRPDFEARGWKAMRLLWMRHEAAPPGGAAVPVEEVSYDAVHGLRLAWHREDSPEEEAAHYHSQAREVALSRGVQVIAVCEPGELVGFAQIARDGAAAEISQVYVDARHRGAGRGTALTRSAIEAAGDVRDLWICADDEARPKELYARLGFRPVWTAMEFTRWP